MARTLKVKNVSRYIFQPENNEVETIATEKLKKELTIIIDGDHFARLVVGLHHHFAFTILHHSHVTLSLSSEISPSFAPNLFSSLLKNRFTSISV